MEVGEGILLELEGFLRNLWGFRFFWKKEDQIFRKKSI